MSRARLRAVQPTTPAPPDLLLRSFEPPGLVIRGTPLATLLAAAYQALAGAREWRRAEPDALGSPAAGCDRMARPSRMRTVGQE